MDFKIEKYGPTVVMISFDNKTCFLPNEIIKKLQDIGTAGPFRDNLLVEIKSQNIEMADMLRSFLKEQEKIFEIMNRIKILNVG